MLTDNSNIQRNRNNIEPAVSAVMAAYNAEKTILSSINSVISQTYRNWELIVIDDCSQDSTVHIVRSIAEKEPRVRLYENQKNTGVAQSRNFGVKQARSDWIAFLDSDDRWREDKLTRQMRFIAETGAKISYTATAYTDAAGVVSSYVLRAKRVFTYKELLKRNIMSCSSVIVWRDIMARIPFTENVLHEDYATWMRILREVKCAYGLDEPLLIYRISGSSKSGKRIRSAKMTYCAYREVKFGRAAAALLTLRYALHSISKHTMIRIGRI